MWCKSDRHLPDDNVTVELGDSLGNLIPDEMGTGAVQYYAGGWRDFGVTAGRAGQQRNCCRWATASPDLCQRAPAVEQPERWANPVVTFQTTNVTVELARQPWQP